MNEKRIETIKDQLKYAGELLDRVKNSTQFIEILDAMDAQKAPSDYIQIEVSLLNENESCKKVCRLSKLPTSLLVLLRVLGLQEKDIREKAFAEMEIGGDVQG